MVLRWLCVLFSREFPVRCVSSSLVSSLFVVCDLGVTSSLSCTLFFSLAHFLSLSLSLTLTLTFSPVRSALCTLLSGVAGGFTRETLALLMELKGKNRGRLSEFPALSPTAKYFKGKKPWDVPCDVAFPCATQNEVHEDAAKLLAKNGCKALVEGANMVCILCVCVCVSARLCICPVLTSFSVYGLQNSIIIIISLSFSRSRRHRGRLRSTSRTR
jgi:Glutamate/Leucine/Phenylalanine/Valine dehydrogenase